MSKVSQSKGDGSGGYSNGVRKFGRITDLSSGSTAVVWDGGDGYSGWLNDITEDTEEDISIVSDSALDTYVDGLGGNPGAEICQFSGQGADGIEKTYAIPLNGLTPVLLSSYDPGVLFQTIYTAQTYGGPKSPTVLNGNQGTITISSATSGRVMAIILPNLGRTQMMIWRCPSNKYAEFQGIDIYPVSGKPAVLKLLARTADTLNSWLTVGQVDVSGEGALHIVHPFPDHISPGTDICLVITAGTNAVDCSAQMWIQKKNLNG